MISGVVDTVGLAAGVVQVEPPALVAMKAKVDAIVSLVNAGSKYNSAAIVSMNDVMHQR